MKPTIFVSSSSQSRPLVEQLQGELSLDATVVSWADAPFSLVQPPLEQFGQSLSAADFVVFLLDLPSAVRTRGAQQPQPRENILFELGLVIGKLGPDRVLIVDVTTDPEGFRIPSDLSGFVILRAQQHLNPDRLPKYIADVVRQRLLHIEPRASEEKPSYSCFISYSHKDEAFASRLFTDLNAIGARCWLDRHELRAGDSITDQVNAALVATDKFLAVFSAASLASEWFKAELRQALELEAKRSTTVLVPVRIDDTVLSAQGQPWLEMRDRLIADFRDWRNESAYNKAFRRLALNLASSASEDRGLGSL